MRTLKVVLADGQKSPIAFIPTNIICVRLNRADKQQCYIYTEEEDGMYLIEDSYASVIQELDKCLQS